MRIVVLVATTDYLEWHRTRTPKVRAQIDSRLQNVAMYGHMRRLSSVLFELKFNNGNRIYYTERTVDLRTVILILGGGKNGQDKDIKKAQKIAEQIHSN